jgi:hypothetical protein
MRGKEETGDLFIREQIQWCSGVSVVLSPSLYRELELSFIWALSHVVYPQSRIILEMKRASAAEALKRVDMVCGEIRLGEERWWRS